MEKGEKSLMFLLVAVLIVSLLSTGMTYGLYSKVSAFSEITGDIIGAKGEQAVPSAEPSQEPPKKIDVKDLLDDDPFLGKKRAPVTIIEFSDYQCPYCAKFWRDTLPLLKKEYIDKGKVKLVFRDYPLGFHSAAQPAAEAAECARDQGGDETYFDYHDKIFENQPLLSQVSSVNDLLKEWAEELRLDTDDFMACLSSGKYSDEVQQDMADGSAAGIQGTPGFVVNGVLVSGAQPFQVFQQIIEQELN